MEKLLNSFGEDAPSGVNLEYEDVFTALERAAQPGEERRMGDEVIPAEDSDDRDIIDKAMAVLEQSHDLRAAVLLAGSELRLNGFDGFAKATGYIKGCLEQFWDTCHPQLDQDDDNDPTMRKNAILGLADNQTIVRALRNAPMTLSTSFGRVSLRDIMVAEGEMASSPDATNVLDLAGVSAAFQDTDNEILKEMLDGATTALANVRAIDSVFNEQIPGLGPDLNPLLKMLHRITKKLGEETESSDVEIAEEEGEGAAEGGVPAQAKAAPSGAITSRRDVEMALDRILSYYSSHEPSSPLPILLVRAKRLVGADFMTIMKDIAPGGVDNVMTVGGIAEE